LGIDLGRLTTIGDLQGGIEEADRLLGYKTLAIEDGALHSEDQR
jgi:rsbT co-antagonist protein RsbR